MRTLGRLESAVMELLWAADHPLCTQEVREGLRPAGLLAYTTVMTVLDRLYDKGWLRRSKVGRAFRYVPTVTRVEYVARQLDDVLATADDRRAALLCFAERLAPDERKLLRATDV